MNQIEYINIEKLYPHPGNPRKNVGDVSELAASIRHSGIMQNLTVVPYADGYRVVIGHRRLAAAKEAGLTELPCIVSDMDSNEQLSTMVAENMQRADLTFPEQVHGIQMLLDLGNTPEQVMKTTGLSRTTFYHRKNMAGLPSKEFQESWERGGTIADYVALEQIKDLQVRTNLLKEIGTQNFNYKLGQAKSRQALMEIVKDVLLLLEPVAKKLKKSPGCLHWKYIYIQKSAINEVKKTVAEIEADSEADYSFVLNTDNFGSGWLYIYRDGPEQDKKPKEPSKAELQEEARKTRIRALGNLHQQFRELRTAFICAFRETDADVNRILPVFLQDGQYIDSEDVMLHIFGSKGDSKALIEAYMAFCKATPGAVMLAAMEMNREDVVGWDGDYIEPDDEDITEEYLKLLVSLGYHESDDEKAYWNGTHELFFKEDDDA